jgi:hypothetical protein
METGITKPQMFTEDYPAHKLQALVLTAELQHLLSRINTIDKN